jgi:polyribonucleotide nucleotidyltransferase
MSCSIDLVVNNKEEVYELGKVAKQANSSVLYKEGNTVILSTLVYDKENIIEEDFTPLVVQYIEKAYAMAKFPAGFIKREQKPGDFETLTSRIVDRSIRPLFPKGYAYNTVVTTTVLSTDSDTDLQTAALNATNAALYLSDLGVEKAVYGVRIAKIDGEIVVNPKLSALQNSTFDMFVTGTKEELLMIEFKSQGQMDVKFIEAGPNDMALDGTAVDSIDIYNSNEITEDELIEVLQIAQNAISDATKTYEEAFKAHKKEATEITLRISKETTELKDKVKELYYKELEDALNQMAKSERTTALKEVAKKVSEDERFEEEIDAIIEAVDKAKREIVREMILEKRVRADGRDLDEIRPISIETNILPSAHASCLFTRGQTQALAVATLGGEMDAQTYNLLTDSSDQKERFMLHYNFPPFSVGEADRIGPPGRRELGHGNLAKRAIESIIDPSFDATVRVVSEVLESNGSSSMATVCASALSLKGAKVPLNKLVAGVAMGLVTDGDKYAVLTDIMGLEDHDGDMDFKVTGTYDGITAMQMDIKLGGVKLEILKEALYQAKEARYFILELMTKAEEEIVYSKALPQTINFSVLPDKIVDIIGQAGKTVKEIISKFDVSVDLDRKSGNVKITGSSTESVEGAKCHIESIVCKDNGPKKPTVKEGEIVKGVVKRVANFGAFVEIGDGVEGLLHISKLSTRRVERVEDVVEVGDEIEVKVLAVKGFKIELAMANLD